ncbi:MAG: hypothetical protein ACXWUG_28590, partial [Polyangiales bacterium]
MSTRIRVLALVPWLASCAASSSSTDNGAPFSDASSSDDVMQTAEAAIDDGGLLVDAEPVESGAPEGTSTIYASTDTELWSMDPSTKKVTRIGPFGFGALTKENITDVAVDKDGLVYVISETTVFTATLPASGTGTVALAKKLALPSGSKFYALGIAPEGVLESGEALVVGDSLGDLYHVPPSGSAQKLGSFGPWVAGDPPGGKSGDVWQLSGDVVFFSIGGAPRGLATLRPCTKSGACTNGNDVVAEIDMTALATKSATANLRKGFLGAGTGFEKLFGIGAWGDAVYAFSLVSKGTTTTPAALITIDATGKGALTQSFPAITDGWTGAGITTKAKV